MGKCIIFLMATPILQLRSVSKRFDTLAAVSSVNLSVYPGEVVGFVGVNGAGKTTTINMILGFLGASEGMIRLFSNQVVPDNAHTFHADIGYAAGDMAMFDNLTGKQYLSFILHQYSIKDKTRYHELLDIFMPQLDKRIRTLSRGNKQKIALVAAFMTGPKLVILDEPTSGLDPLMQQAFLNLIREERTRGTTIFMSSHILSEVADVCSRVVVIAKGKIVCDIDTVQFEAEEGKRIRVVANRAVRPPRGASEVASQEIGKGEYELVFMFRDTPARLQAWLAGLTGLKDITITDHGLEEAVYELYDKEDER